MKTKEVYFSGKLYKRIKVGKTIYSVFKCSKIKADGLNYIGFVNYTHKEIYIKKQLSKKNFKETLKHELIHAFLNELYKKTKDKKYLRLRGNEFFIENLTYFFDDLKKLRV